MKKMKMKLNCYRVQSMKNNKTKQKFFLLILFLALI